MNWSANLLKMLSVYLLVSLFGCSGGSTEKTDEKLAVNSTSATTTSQNALIDNQTPFAFVERNITQQNAWVSEVFDNALADENGSPIETLLPYSFNLGAALIVRSGLDTSATEENILTGYFGTEEYDVKDLNISPDGTLLLFAARGSTLHPTDSSWNIFTYRFSDQLLTRVISDNNIANAGQDTNPVLTLDGRIIFSSDRDAGDPQNPRTSDEVNEFCDFEDPAENPSLLHSMSIAGQNITQLTFGTLNHDINPTNLADGRIAFVRWERSFETIQNCSANDTPGTSVFPSGFVLPPLWDNTTKCAYSQTTELGTSIATNNYKLLTITSDGGLMEQLYQTSTTTSSDEAFLMIDQILQAENGNLFSLIRHQYNQSLGGALVELQPQQEAQAGIVLSKLSPLSLNTPEIDLYPEQLSQGGWYSSFWAYRDGTSRLLVSWSQCSLINGDVSSFCDSGATGELDVNYGIWVFDPASETRTPIVRAKDNTVFTELAMAQPHTTANLNITPFNPNFIDNPDGTVVVCHYPNEMPIAMAGGDQAGYAGDVFNFDGSASSDPDQDPLTYQWVITSAPAQSSASLVNATSVTPSLEADLAGQYVVELVVNDGEIDSLPDSLTVNAMQNNPPIADASIDKTVVVNDLVSLDGSNSSDVDGHSLTFQWSIISQPSNIVLSNPTSVNPSFTPNQIGEYVFELVVNDGFVDSAPDRVTIIAQSINLAPVANAGFDQTGDTGMVVFLDGSNSSDPENAALSYQWSVASSPSGASYTLINGDQVNPSFVANTSGGYVISLVVNDGVISSQLDSVNITINQLNTSPTANAGIDQIGEIGQQLILDGSASSDPENDPLSYQWSLLSAPAESAANLINSNSVNPTLSADVVGEYIVQLIVSDGVLTSPPDAVVVTARDSNTAPVANAGVDQQNVGTLLMLDGSASSDVDGDSLTYQWTIVSPTVTSVTLSDPTSVSPTILPDSNENYVIELVVFDGSLFSQPDQMSINYINTKPIADAGMDQSAIVGDSVQLDGSGSSDANGDTLTYQWRIASMPANSQAVLSNPSLVNPTIVADAEGYFELELIVNDGIIDSDPDFMMINTMNENTAPIADAGDDQAVQLGMPTLLDGSGSFDSDGDPLTYRWEILSKPDSSVATLNNPTSVSPSIEFDVLGDYVIQLIVNDGTINSAPDTVMFAHENMRPIADAGIDQAANTGDPVSLDGSASYDPDGDAINYAWSITSQPADSNVLFDNPLSVTPVFIPELVGTYVIQLIVNDGVLDSLADTVIIETACMENCEDEDDRCEENDDYHHTGSGDDDDCDDDGDDQCHEDDENDDGHHSSSSEDDDDCDDDGDDQCHEDDENDDGHHSSSEDDDDCDDDGDDQCHEEDENDDGHHSSSEDDDDCDDDGDDQCHEDDENDNGHHSSNEEDDCEDEHDEEECDENDLSQSVEVSLLWPPNHNLVEVGFELENECDNESDDGAEQGFATTVWSDEEELNHPSNGGGHFAPDAKLENDTLRLRKERNGHEDGRVYLIFTHGVNEQQQSIYQCSTVVVPHANSSAAIESAFTQAQNALNYCETNGEIPDGFFQHGVSGEVGPKQ